MALTLIDCKNHLLNVFNSSSQQFTVSLEKQGKEIVNAILDHGDTPTDDDLDLAERFLVGVELWKANCDGDKTGYAARNASKYIWIALKDAVNGSTDVAKLNSVMGLFGFGSSVNQVTGKRRAKRATAVMRFLDPKMWGVVDWRVAAVIGLYENKCSKDIEQAVKLGKTHHIGQMAESYDEIDENLALYYENLYREMRNPELPRAVDVELAFYGASYLAWP